jgi:hypothetical protein
MAIKFKGSQATGASYRLGSDIPLDERLVVSYYSDLFKTNTFLYINKENTVTDTQTAYPGMVVAVIEDHPSRNGLYLLKALPSIEESNWERISMPQLSENVEGKLLTVEKINIGTAEAPVYKYEAQWADAPSGLPTINPQTDANKILQVNANGDGVAWVDTPDELPSFTTSDKDKVLTVSSNGVDIEWSEIDTSFVKNIDYPEFEYLITTGKLKPGMKYRTQYQMPLNTSKTFNTIYGQYRLGLGYPESPFDIILTASSPTTFFDDVELITNNSGLELGYEKNHFSKYDAKMEILLNVSVNKYSYIDTNAPYVITYMKDDKGNEADYDFVNLRYVEISTKIEYPTFSEQFKPNRMEMRVAIVRNLKIKSPSKYELPFVIYQFDTYGHPTMAGAVELINNVTISNSTNIFIKNVILSNSNILNSRDIRFDIQTSALDSEGELIEQYCDSTIQIDNMTIVDNINLTIRERATDIPNISVDTNTSFISNINFVPCHKHRTMSFMRLLSEMRTTIGVSISEMNNIELTSNWLSYIINVNEPLPCLSMLFGKEIPSNLTPIERNIFDLVKTSTKNITYSIFEFDKPYTIEIPQFQSTATSVVELGLN